MCTVINLATRKTQFFTCSPEQAVIAAFAQSQGDWNTWNYVEKYSWLVEEGEKTVICGDFSAYKDGHSF